MRFSTITLCALLLVSMLVVISAPSDADDYPEEEVPDPPWPFESESPSFSGFGISYETGWNDTTFSFHLNTTMDYFWNETIPRQNETVQVWVDNTAYDLFENNTKDTNWTDGKHWFWMNEERLWSKGLIPYLFYIEVNETSNTTETNYFEILNRAPYMLEPPLNQIYVTEEMEWEGRATDEDLDPLTWTFETAITEDDACEIEWETINYSFKLKIKCNQTFAKWINLTVFDPYNNLAYWNWTLYCVVNESGSGYNPPTPRLPPQLPRFIDRIGVSDGVADQIKWR